MNDVSIRYTQDVHIHSRILILGMVGLLVVTAGLALFPRSIWAQYDVSQEVITEFVSDIVIHPDSSFVVTETITYDFSDTPRHGVYRTLPYRYTRNGARYTIRYQMLSVTDQHGAPYPYTQSTNGGDLEVRIGDPNQTITGTHIYVLTYSVRRAINYFEDHDELYWNVTGHEWSVPIKVSAASVVLPDRASALQVACYTGQYGSTATDCLAEHVDAGYSRFASNDVLSSGEGLTIVVSLAKGVVSEPTVVQKILQVVADNWYFVLPLVAWLLMHIHWVKKGRDPQFHGAIIPEYEVPDNLTPHVVGTLWDTKADTKELSATIIYLAVRGYLKIRDLGNKDYEFVLLKADTSKLDTVERQLMLALFSTLNVGKTVQLADLTNKFYKHIPEIKKQMYTALVSHGLYAKNPNTIRSVYVGIGIAMVGLTLFTGIVALPFGFGVAIPIGILLCVYGWIMPAKTTHGAKMVHALKGFKWFLSVTETERLKFHQAPEKKPEQFEKFLPYAMVFGVEKQWAKQFEDVMLAQPTWYEGNVNAFTAIILASALSDMSGKMNSTFTSRPNSAGGGSSGFGGGGFSGGGFGGGGGGSW